jgi:Heterokaryon incompatibility protein (HET)
MERQHDLNLARLWIAESINKTNVQDSNPSPKNPSSHNCLPTRLLELGPKMGKNTKLSSILSYFTPSRRRQQCPIRLISPTEGSEVQYVALSHRWGTSQHFLTTTENIDSHKKEMHLSEFPRLFQDAILVTKKLGYQYLWVDALCIIQDDRHDWLQQSSQMAAIYRNATCTIAAHSAENDSHSFLNFNPSILTADVISRDRSDGSFRFQVNQSGLSRRGWVFQERILSTRILHFAQNHLFFEDKFGIQVEKRNEKHNRDYDPLNDARISLDDFIESTTEWYKLMERYTICALTYETDRLHGVAGLVSYLQRHRIDTPYYFGIWTDTIHQGLLWFRKDKPFREPSLSGLPRPPSWSWAHWEGSIQYPKTISEFYRRVAFVDCIRNSRENLLHLTETESFNSRPIIRLKALVQPMTGLTLSPSHLLRSSPIIGTMNYKESIEQAYKHTLCDHLDNLEKFYGLWGKMESGLDKFIGFVQFDADYETVPDLSNLFYTEIAKYSRTWMDYFDDDSSQYRSINIAFILLLSRSTEESYHSRYQRIGMGALSSSDEFHNIQDELIELE